MVINTQPAALVSTKSARSRYLFKSVADAFFFTGNLKEDQLDSLLLAADGAPLLTLVELHVKWENYKGCRAKAPHPLEGKLELVLRQAVVEYSKTWTI